MWGVQFRVRVGRRLSSSSNEQEVTVNVALIRCVKTLSCWLIKRVNNHFDQCIRCLLYTIIHCTQSGRVRDLWLDAATGMPTTIVDLLPPRRLEDTTQLSYSHYSHTHDHVVTIHPKCRSGIINHQQYQPSSNIKTSSKIAKPWDVKEKSPRLSFHHPDYDFTNCYVTTK